MFVGGFAAFAVAASLAAFGARSFWLTCVAALAGLIAIYFFAMGCYMLYGSKIAKVRDRGRMLDLIPWPADGVVLDVGCGRGLLLIEAAKRVPRGRAVGIDLWQAEDQAGNTPDATMGNAQLEGVTDRVEVRTGDMRQLPFLDATFDVIVSHWAVHNLYQASERAVALNEMGRVLKVGGHVLLADIEHRDEYADHIRSIGFVNVRQVVNPIRDVVLGALTFGSFRPATVVGRKETDVQVRPSAA